MPGCPSCGADEETGTGYCSYCGNRLPRPATAVPLDTPDGSTNLRPSRSSAYPPGQPPIKNWLTESILVTILCCMPLGIGGVINATSVDRLASCGDMDGARRAASRAKNFVVAAVVLGVLTTLFYAVVQLLAAIGDR